MLTVVCYCRCIVIMIFEWVSEWVIVVQRQHSNFSAMSWREQMKGNESLASIGWKWHHYKGQCTGITKIRLTMPRVKLSRADRNPWLAKMPTQTSGLPQCTTQHSSLVLPKAQHIPLVCSKPQRNILVCFKLQPSTNLWFVPSFKATQTLLRRTRGVCCVDSCGEPALCVLLNLGQTKL
jgi:hypothetical protein